MRDGSGGRFDVLEEPTGRRFWPDEAKARIGPESLAPGARVGEVARRRRLSPSRPTTWRRHARQGRIALPMDAPGLPTAVASVPPIFDAPAAPPRSSERQDRIEIGADGLVIRLPGTTPATRTIGRPLSSTRSTACRLKLSGKWRRFFASIGHSSLGSKAVARVSTRPGQDRLCERDVAVRPDLGRDLPRPPMIGDPEAAATRSSPPAPVSPPARSCRRRQAASPVAPTVRIRPDRGTVWKRRSRRASPPSARRRRSLHRRTAHRPFSAPSGSRTPRSPPCGSTGTATRRRRCKGAGRRAAIRRR